MLKVNIPPSAKGFFAATQIVDSNNKDILFLVSNEEAAQNIFTNCLFFNHKKTFFLPSFDCAPYDIVSPCSMILADRAKTLTSLTLTKDTPKILVTNAINLITKLPPPAIFINNNLTLHKKLKITIETLAKFLSQNGFIRSSAAIDSGEFAIKGEIFDIVIAENEAYRILFNWGNIDLIKKYDPLSQLSKEIINELIITPASEVIINPETILNFKNNYLKNFGINHTKIPLFNAIIEQRKYPAYEHLMSLFYEQTCNITNYLNDPIIIYDNLALQTILEHQASFADFYSARINANKLNPENFYPALEPSLLIVDIHQTNKLLNKKQNVLINGETEADEDIKVITNDARSMLASRASYDSDTLTLHNDNLLVIETYKNTKTIIIFCTSPHGLENIKNLLQKANYSYVEIDKVIKAKFGLINLACNINLDTSFLTSSYLCIAQQDVLPDKHPVKRAINSSQKRLKNILIELEGLQENELVVHKEHGIGQFLALTTIEAGGKPHDCLKILYAENVKLYIPVENIDAIKKYGNFEVALDRLGSSSWQKRKAKLKNRINDIARTLLETTAKRKLAVANPITYDIELYDKFCQKFPYVETDDQLKAIEDIKEDLASGIIMDRLICGDVGFGKTEVALRAAFIVAMDKSQNMPQVAVIVPTTILCNQHYKRFCERFSGFNLKIVSLSRLVSSKDIKQIKEEIKTGGANIIIGTHAILSKNLEFNNLKLLIIDEEQHFGVAQKESLKQLTPYLHVLCLSATPIPRTLQMSMVGLKDLSLIAEAPMDRLAIRTSIMPYDGVIIKDALLKEHTRGGKSFYVVPRISDITTIETRLNKLVPELKYKIVHGGLAPLVVDKIMQEFDEGKFDILISTSIIESGIDIPTANTMIIHKSDQFGLAQSYQLRGRIGRGKIRGYVYFTLENKKTTGGALRRLEILQTIDTLGAGFTIASHDMDFRGFGNLVGDEQSGHIKEVGIELYQDMLDEQIMLLNSQKIEVTKQIEERVSPAINLGLAVFIAKDYIADSTLRLGIYRRIGNLNEAAEIENFKDEMIDRFGPIPIELDNLLAIVNIKQICKVLNISSLDAAEKGWALKFYPDSNVHNMVLEFIKKFPTHAKIKPDNKLIFIKNLKKDNILKETLWLLDSMKARLNRP